jgi:CRISPR/Cas system-associated exonuclease Cas4 (RecB family)
MVYFLERIAKLLYDQNGGEIGNHCLVFPSRRAGLYFLKYYSALLERPVWTPSVMTISEFFGSFSNLVPADNEILLFELYKKYRELNPSAESFDEFYFWGDMLIDDFDDVDKYMADASVILRNVKDFKNIDYQFGDIDPEQAEIIRRFWKNFEPEKHSPEKNGFKAIWAILSELYSGFRICLRSKELAYEGMIFRDVAEKSINNELDELKWNTVHFIGFNALNKCEITLMKQLQKKGKARFYWDYDNSYIKEGKLNSAGLFLIKNLKLFGNDMADDWQYDTLLSSQNANHIRKIVETASDIAQVKLLPHLIDKISGLSAEDAHHTAVILAEENLIVPLLTSLPGNIGEINITMGYPLKMTGVYSLVKHFLELQRNSVVEGNNVYFGFKDVLEILKNQLIDSILEEEDRIISDEIVNRNLVRVPSDFLCRSEILKMIFRKAGDPAELSDYLREMLTMISNIDDDAEDINGGGITQKKLRNEFVYSVLLTVNRLETIVRSPDVSFKNDTYIRILDKILRNQSVPFSGEPVTGIQIMGFLETRALDFRNIIMLSVNEGILPSITSASSFIPFSIREAFGLPVINHQESVYAYHFYRLLHRAENVTFVYNSDSTGLRTGEMSRFLIQMKYEQIIKPAILNLSFDIKTPVSIGSEIKKNSENLNRLRALYTDPESNALLSPSAINTWLNCRMRFYYRYVSRLKEPEVISTEIDHAAFGQVLHSVMKNIYSSSLKKEVTAGHINSLIKDESYILNIIDQSINEIYNSDLLRPLSGNDIIIRDILFAYTMRILGTDKILAPFTILELERAFSFLISFESDGVSEKLKTGGNIDRIDRLSGKTRIVDYKTGETVQKINSIDDLFMDDRKKELDGWLQTMLYCEAYLTVNPGIVLQPSIYKVKELSADNFSETLRIGEERKSNFRIEDYELVRNDFLDGLKAVISTIFSHDEPFRMTSNLNKCGYCPYSGLCQR